MARRYSKLDKWLHCDNCYKGYLTAIQGLQWDMAYINETARYLETLKFLRLKLGEIHQHAGKLRAAIS